MLSAGKLKYLRLLHNLTQQDIADYLHCSKNFISEIERGVHTYSQQKHDQIVNAIYVVSEQKKKQKDNPEQILDDVGKVEKSKKNTKNNKSK